MSLLPDTGTGANLSSDLMCGQVDHRLLAVREYKGLQRIAWEWSQWLLKPTQKHKTIVFSIKGSFN